MIAPLELVDLLARHPALAGLPPEVLAQMAGCSRNIAIAPGSLLLLEGQPADALYLLRRGRVALEAHEPGRSPAVVETVEPGGVVGWSWLDHAEPWPFDARATEPVGAVELDVNCLRGKWAADPQLGLLLVQRLSTVLLGSLQAARLRLLDLYGDGHRV